VVIVNRFKNFWLDNKDRYLKIAELNVKLALNIACEDAWEMGEKCGEEEMKERRGIFSGSCPKKKLFGFDNEEEKKEAVK